jgi:hypothetical protein
LQTKLLPFLASNQVSSNRFICVLATSQLHRSNTQDELRLKLEELNSLDIKLYRYAESLVALRLREIKQVFAKVKDKTPRNIHRAESCNPIPMTLIMRYKPYFGVFQPPGHKGP